MRLDSFKTKAEVIRYIRQNVPGAVTNAAAEKYLKAHLPKEAHYQKKIMDAVRKAYPGSFVWKESAGVYARQGIPDVSAVINGHYFCFEVKRPFVGVTSKIQRVTIKKLNEAGGTAAVVCLPEEALKLIIDFFGGKNE